MRHLKLYADDASQPETVACEACGGPMTRPPTAPHKRFCSEACRNSWHTERLRRARNLLKETEQKESSSKGPYFEDGEEADWCKMS